MRRVKGEEGAVDQQEVSNWKAAVLMPILSRYPPEDIWNLDETGLNWKLLPDTTLAFKGRCFGM